MIRAECGAGHGRHKRQAASRRHVEMLIAGQLVAETAHLRPRRAGGLNMAAPLATGQFDVRICR